MREDRNRPRWDLVLFDLDGTLVDSLPWFLSILPEVAARHRFRVPESDVEREALRAMGPRAVQAHLAVPHWRLPLIAREMRRRKSAAGALPLFPGVAPMLRRLHAAGVTLALATSDAEANSRRSLGADAALIRHWGCGASLFGKPRVLRRVLRAAGAAPAGAILIGDEVRDAEAARAVGIAFGAVTWGYGAAHALRAQAPAAVFERAEEIVPTLLGTR